MAHQLPVLPVFVQGPNDGKKRTVRLRVDDGSAAREVLTSFIAP